MHGRSRTPLVGNAPQLLQDYPPGTVLDIFATNRSVATMTHIDATKLQSLSKHLLAIPLRKIERLYISQPLSSYGCTATGSTISTMSTLLSALFCL
jgi:hypothetical protein